MTGMGANDTLLRALHTHADPRWGSTYWREYLGRRGLKPEDVAADPACVGLMDAEALRCRPVEDFIPARLLADRVRLVTSETSGMTGKPVVTVFTDAEFHEAFVEPFLRRAAETGFPLRSNWLWAGPSGPHAIGKAVREILRAAGGLDPFSVDFDPRWYRRLPEDSVGRTRYMAHVEAQIMDVLDTQRVDVIFSTPPVIRRIAERLGEKRRAALRGIHYGGMSISAAEYAGFRDAFPNAVHLHGYGNSLFGVFVETGFGPAGIEYGTSSARVRVDVVREVSGRWTPCADGETGRVMLSRFDESFLILNHLERDVATRLPGAIRDPHPPQPQTNRQTLY